MFNVKQYTYNNHTTGEVVVVLAENILAADKQFKALTGIEPIKASDIGCSMKPAALWMLGGP